MTYLAREHTSWSLWVNRCPHICKRRPATHTVRKLPPIRHTSTPIPTIEVKRIALFNLAPGNSIVINGWQIRRTNNSRSIVLIINRGDATKEFRGKYAYQRAWEFATDDASDAA